MLLYCWVSKCSTEHFPKLLTSILSAVKTELQSNCDTSYSKGGVNQVGILRNLTNCQNIYNQDPSLRIKTFDFSTLYESISYSKLRDRLKELKKTVFHNNMVIVYTTNLSYMKNKSYFVKNRSHSTKSSLKLKMIEFFLIDTIFVLLSCFNRQSAFLQVLTALLFSSISYRSFSRKTKRSYPDPLMSFH